MSGRKASSDTRRPSEVHITSWAELDRHLSDAGKWVRYERLLVDFGFDPEAFSRRGRRASRLIYAEQPGGWLYPDDLARARLLAALIERGRFAEDSGCLALANDSYRHWGAKQFFVDLYLDRDLGVTSFLSGGFHRRHRHLAYGALRIDGRALERTRAIFATVDALLAAASSSPDDFAAEVANRLRRNGPVAARRLLPGSLSRQALRELGRRLRGADLETARRPLRLGRELCEAGDDVSWFDLWSRVNGAFFDHPIEDLSPTLNRYLLAVRDPRRLVEKLLELDPRTGKRRITVAGIVDPRGRFRLVTCDRRTGELAVAAGTGHHPISWSEIREHALEGATGGPAALAQYLALAADGIYLIGDPVDGWSAFERQAAAAHRQYTGLKFPRIALPKPFATWPNYYLDAHTEAFGGYWSAAHERFFSRGPRRQPKPDLVRIKTSKKRRSRR